MTAALDHTDAPTVPDAYLAWTPWTDTAEIPSFQRGLPIADQPTVEMHLLDLPPAVTPARRRRRFLSREDLAASWGSAVTVVGGIATGVIVLSFLSLTRPLGVLLVALTHGGH